MNIAEMITSLREKVFDTAATPIMSDATYERLLRDAMFIHFTTAYTDLNDIPEEKFPVMLLLAASIAATMRSSEQSSVNSTISGTGTLSRLAINLGGALSVSETTDDSVNQGSSASKSVVNWRQVAEHYQALYDKAIEVTTGQTTVMPYIEQGYLSRTSKNTGATSLRQWMKAPAVPTLAVSDYDSTSVLLSWSFPVNSALEQASMFQIWYNTSANVKQGQDAKFVIGTTTSKRGFNTGNLETRWAKITGLTSGSQYYLKLFVFNKDGNQKPAESNEVTVTLP